MQNSTRRILASLAAAMAFFGTGAAAGRYQALAEGDAARQEKDREIQSSLLRMERVAGMSSGSEARSAATLATLTGWGTHLNAEIDYTDKILVIGSEVVGRIPKRVTNCEPNTTDPNCVDSREAAARANAIFENLKRQAAENTGEARIITGASSSAAVRPDTRNQMVAASIPSSGLNH